MQMSASATDAWTTWLTGPNSTPMCRSTPQRASLAISGYSAKRTSSTTTPVAGSTATASCFSGQDRWICDTVYAEPGALGQASSTGSDSPLPRAARSTASTPTSTVAAAGTFGVLP